MAATAYREAEQRVARLARQLLPQAACPDDRMRLLFLYAAEETYLAACSRRCTPTTPSGGRPASPPTSWPASWPG